MNYTLTVAELVVELKLRYGLLPPGVVIVKFLDYADKLRVMKATSEREQILHDSQRAPASPDASVDFQMWSVEYGIAHLVKFLETFKRNQTHLHTALNAELVYKLKTFGSW